MGFNGFYWVSMGFNGFYWVLLGFIGSDRVETMFIQFNDGLMRTTGFYLVFYELSWY